MFRFSLLGPYDWQVWAVNAEAYFEKYRGISQATDMSLSNRRIIRHLKSPKSSIKF
jgi:hypothetical protein